MTSNQSRLQEVTKSRQAAERRAANAVAEVDRVELENAALLSDLNTVKEQEQQCSLQLTAEQRSREVEVSLLKAKLRNGENSIKRLKVEMSRQPVQQRHQQQQKQQAGSSSGSEWEGNSVSGSLSGGRAPLLVFRQLQDTLQQRQSELQTQAETLRQLEIQREEAVSNAETLTQQLSQMQSVSSELMLVKQQLRTALARQEVLLQMVGEKEEEVENLQAEMCDVKEIFQQQVSQLLNQMDSGH